MTTSTPKNDLSSQNLQNKNKDLIFFITFLASLTVVSLRIFLPFEMGWDESIQTEAAYRMTHGLGYTSTYFTTADYDINRMPAFYRITWWPPGFSLLLSALLSLKIPLWAALKTIFATITLVGWLGWAALAATYLSQSGMLTGKMFKFLILVIAIALPFYFTPPWNGSDAILWAAMPAYILFLSKALDKNSSTNTFIFLSGAIFGGLCFFRYASLFLGLCAFLTFFIRNHPWKNYVKFYASALLMLIILHFGGLTSANEGSILPQYVAKTRELNLPQSLASIGKDLTTVIHLLPLPGTAKFIHLLNQHKILNLIVGIGCILFIAAIPWAVVRKQGSKDTGQEANGILILSILPLCLICQLIVVTALSNPFYPFVGDFRYYWCLLPANVIFLFILATRFYEKRGAFVLAFVLIFFAGNFFIQSLLEINNTAAMLQKLLAQKPLINQDIYTGHESDELFLRKIAEDNPAAQIFIQSLPFFIYEGDAARFRPIPGQEFWRQAYFTKPTRIFWAVSTRNCHEVCQTAAYEIAFPKDSVPELKEIYFNPTTTVKIYMADLPANYKFKI